MPAANEPKPDECHHFNRMKLVCVVHGEYEATVCSVCEIVISGFFFGIVPPCARHYHGK